ncbi:hypothetical protein GQ600_21708 [Phytophthora cactorum]|nr:hypothetical protein GQ600_21708 [Phytophthora cactorum]
MVSAEFLAAPPPTNVAWVVACLGCTHRYLALVLRGAQRKPILAEIEATTATSGDKLLTKNGVLWCLVCLTTSCCLWFIVTRSPRKVTWKESDVLRSCLAEHKATRSLVSLAWSEVWHCRSLLAYEPLQQLQHENFLLREENRRLQSEVREFDMEDKAIAHMAAMAPLAGVLHRAKQLQQQLRTVESSLKSRGALELATTELETEREALQHRIEGRADEAEAQLAAMGESFRLHLERLVAMRESLDDADGKSRNNKENQQRSRYRRTQPKQQYNTTIRNTGS